MASTYYIDNIKYIDTYNLLDSGALHDSNHKLSGTTGNFETTGTIKANTGIFNELIAVNLNARNATIDELTAQNATVMGIMDVKGKLMTNSWEAASIANVGGNFYISPTGKDTGTPNITITCNSVSSGAGTYTITVSKGGSSGQGNGFGVSSTNSSLWSKGSRVLMTGNVKFGTKNYPLGSLDGIVSTGNNGIVISSNLITSITLTSVVSSALDLIFTEQSTLAANQSLSGTSNGSNMQISLYQNKTGSYFYPIGILLSSYGQSDKQQYIDIYNGSIRLGRNASDTVNVTTGMAEPVVRIGDLEGLPNIVDSSSNENTRPTGWGIYTTNGFFKGKIVANAGLIGGYTIGTDNLTKGTTRDASGSFWITPAQSSNSSMSQLATATWAITTGQNFGVTTAGKLYAKGADIGGKITATEGQIGPWFINSSSISRNANGSAAGSYNTASNLYFGTSGLSLGTIFKVDSSGNLTATNAKLNNLTIYDENGYKRAAATTSGFIIYDGASATTNVELASFGNSIRIGKSDYGHIDIASDGIVIRGNQDGSQLSPSNDYYTYLTSSAIFIGGGGVNVAQLDMGGSCAHIDVGTNSTGNWTNIYTQTEGTYYHPDTAITQIGAVNSSGHWGSIDIQSTDRTGVDETIIGLQAQSIHANGDFYIKNHSSPIGNLQSASANVAITTANINTYSIGPSLTLTPGTYIIRGVAQFNSTSSPTSPRITDIDLATDNSTSSTASPLSRVRVCHGTGYWARLEAIAPVVVTENTTVYVKISASVTSTAQGCVINALRIV